MRLFLIFFVAALIGLGLGAFAYSGLPESVPVHWGAGGQPDRYGSKWEAILSMPIVLGFLGVIFGLVPKFSRTPITAKTIKSLELVALATSVFLLAIHQVLLSNKPDSMMKVMPVLFSGLLFVMGLAVKGIDRNPVMGIRLPWTMRSDEAWRRTHDSASRLWTIGGIALLIAALLGAHMMVAILGFSVLICLPILTSYFACRSI